MSAATTNILAVTKTATGALGTTGRCRIKGIYYVVASSAGSISLKDGGSTGNELLNIATPANTAGTGVVSVWLPGDGILFQADPYLTLTNVTSVTFFYG